MKTIEERTASATARWDRAVRSISFWRLTVASSRWLLTSSRALLERRGPPFRGGSGPLPDESMVRIRLRTLIDSGALPRVHASLLSGGPCHTPQACMVCGADIEVGRIQFTIRAAPESAIAVHVRCFDLWAQEAAVLVGQSKAAVTRSRGTVERARSTISFSRALLDRPRPAFSGGSDESRDEATIRTRLRVLVNGGLLPQTFSGEIWAGRCTARHDCMVCTSVIEVGDVEYELTVDGLVVFLHKQCFSLWHRHGKSAESATS
jgi:hypothetical protein